MNDDVNDGKRDFLRTAAGAGRRRRDARGGDFAARGDGANARNRHPRDVEPGQGEEGRRAARRLSQTGPWFYKDAKTGELGASTRTPSNASQKKMEVKVEWKEVTFQNSTVGLRRNDYDLYGSSLTYTLARALVVDYVGPLWAKGSLLMVHRDNAARFKRLSDFNDPKVTFSVVAGGSEEPRIPVLFPNAKLITTAGQVVLAAEPIRAKKADVWMSGDSDVLLFAEAQQLGACLRPRHPDRQAPQHVGRSLWRQRMEAFLDFWATFMVVNGEMDRLFKLHMEKLGAA